MLATGQSGCAGAGVKLEPGEGALLPWPAGHTPGSPAAGPSAVDAGRYALSPAALLGDGSGDLGGHPCARLRPGASSGSPAGEAHDLPRDEARLGRVQTDVADAPPRSQTVLYYRLHGQEMVSLPGCHYWVR